MLLPLLHHCHHQLPELLLLHLVGLQLHGLLQGRLHEPMSLIAVEDKFFVCSHLRPSPRPVTIWNTASVKKLPAHLVLHLAIRVGVDGKGRHNGLEPALVVQAELVVLRHVGDPVANQPQLSSRLLLAEEAGGGDGHGGDDGVGWSLDLRLHEGDHWLRLWNH